MKSARRAAIVGCLRIDSDKQLAYDEITEFLAHGIFALDRHPELRLVFLEQMKAAVRLHGASMDGGRYFRRKDVCAVFEDIIEKAHGIHSAELRKRLPEQRIELDTALNTSLRRVLSVIKRLMPVER